MDVCGSGFDAEQQAAAIAYDLAIVDWMLPEGDGLGVCRALRRRGLTLPIMMLTARGEVAERVLGLEAGADDYLREALSRRRVSRARPRPPSPRAGHARAPRARRPRDRPGRPHGDGEPARGRPHEPRVHPVLRAARAAARPASHAERAPRAGVGGALRLGRRTSSRCTSVGCARSSATTRGAHRDGAGPGLSPPLAARGRGPAVTFRTGSSPR